MDIVSSEILIDALSKYEGTLLFVSHNHSFVNRIASKVWNIESGTVEEFPGNLNDYFFHLKILEQQNSAGASEETGPSEFDTPDKAKLTRISRKELRRIEAQRRQKMSGALTPIKSELRNIEKRIETLEQKESELSQLLSDPAVYSDPEQNQPLIAEYNEVKGELQKLMNDWEETQLRLEEVESRLSTELEKM